MSSKDNDLIKKIINTFETSTGKKRRHTATAQDWFRNNLRKNYGNVRTSRLMQNADFMAKPSIGGLYHFSYDPKTKATLPVYDAFPLVFPFALTDDGLGFYGINLHFLAPKLRMAVFVELLKLKTTSGYNKRTKLALDYGKLKSMSNSRALQHAIKRYRFDHMRSKFIKIEPDVWSILVNLPTERFKKGSKSQAWNS